MKLDAHRWCGTFVFAVALIVYAMTMASSVSFWDCGEFTACSYTLAVPHPPGSPLFLLLGRFFSLLPLANDIAVRVTWISVLTSAFAILLAYLIIVRLIRKIRGIEQTLLDKAVTYGGAMVGSLTLGWSYSMWFNAVESEVYATSQLFTHLVVWMILVWYEKADEPGNERWLLMIAYVMGLSTGVHLLNVLTIPALALLLYFRRRKFQMGSFVGMLLASFVVLGLVYPGVVKWLPGLASKVNLWAPFIVLAGIAAAFWWAVRNRHGITGVGMAGLLLIIIGYSGYMMIYVRSGMNTGIDENDPDTPARFLSYLNREQYGDRSMFPRMWNNDPEYKSESDFFWRYQVSKMFNRYLFWQFVGREGAPDREFQDAGVAPNYTALRFISPDAGGLVRWLAILFCFPFVLGIVGLFYQIAKDKHSWLFVAALFFMTGYAIILYLNQDNPQPRERDYSYVGAFFAFALWVGIGAGAVIEWLSEKIKTVQNRGKVALAVALLLFLLSPVMLLANNYPMQNRTGNDVAWDYSYNMLQSCAPNGILFTNGDNDTFPVWYLQEVEKVRRDVRIVNLSLLNTGWYVKQLKHRDPKVPISFSDTYIDRYFDEHDATAILSRYWPPEKHKVELTTPEGKMTWNMPAAMFIPYKSNESRDPNFLRVQDIMILDILRTNLDPSKTPNPRPIYFAVTVANSNMIGLRDYLTMEGLVFRLNPRGGQQINPDAIKTQLLVTFKNHFRGIADPTVHYDDNVSKLLQNYRSAFLQLAYHYSTRPQDASLDNTDFPTLDERLKKFDNLAYKQRALTLLMLMDAKIPESVRPIGNLELSLQIGRMYSELGRPEELRHRLDLAMSRSDLSFDSKLRIASMLISSFNDTLRANAMITQALGSTPTAKQLYTAGTQMYSGGAYRRAAEYLERALQMDQEDGQVIGALMQVYDALNDYGRASSLLESWLKKHPTDTGARQRLDQLQKKMGVALDTSRSLN